jgi:hypothetical protein
MGTHIDMYGYMAYIGSMKTTIDISDHLLNRGKELAREKNTTLKELIEEGLQLVLAAHAARKPHPIEPVIFGGQGLSPEFRGKSWAEIRDTIYEGYGT